MKHKLIFLLIAIFGICFLSDLKGQEITISGVVSDGSGEPLIGATVMVKGTTNGVVADLDGRYQIYVDSSDSLNVLVFTYVGYETVEVDIQGKQEINVSLKKSSNLSEVIVVATRTPQKVLNSPISVNSISMKEFSAASLGFSVISKGRKKKKTFNTESYSVINENIFKNVKKNPLSTFSVDVDAASYSNMRRYINAGYLPPKDAVRLEEMINYFDYDYPQPDGRDPFSITTEMADCPWNKENLLLHIGLQGKEIPMDDLPPSNIVFLIDVSGSMSDGNKLPLLKSSFKLLLKKLRAQDRVAIVVYAGRAGLVLNSTTCDNRTEILNALEQLRAGGSTAGGEGLKLAYQVAEDHFIENGNNRIVLATDGDFNVGQSSDGEMKRLIKENREKGVSISVLGFGMGNYKDSKMETIADNGNGNYAYIDNLLEARKVLVKEFGGTLFTIAKDVKFQLEFNPAEVSEYRLIGYENRLLEDEDFKNDKKDAGDIGAGHSVTALYEIVLAKKRKAKSKRLKYQKSESTKMARESNDLITLKLRYKKPRKITSKLIEQVVKNEPVTMDKATNNFKFSAAVAEFGMLLRDSEFKGTSTWESAIDLAKNSQGDDLEGYRAEMIRLMESARGLTKE